MLKYLAKRVVMTVLVLLMVILFLSLLVEVVPGDPAKVLLGPRATPALVAKIRAEMDLDQPALVQAGRFLGRVVHGNLGKDVFTGKSINMLIGSALPHTLILAWTSLALAVLVGVPLGIYSATHPGHWLDRLTTIISVSFITVPPYVAGLFLLLIFSVQLRMLPALGAGKLSDPGDYLAHLVLPVVALAITWVGYLARLVRASMLEVLNENFVRAARAAGIAEGRVLYKYALKNALIPTVAVLGVGIGSLMGGAVFVEVIFNRPGMGTLIYNGILTRNYPIVRAGVLVVALLFVVTNLVTDILYTWLDPRVQLGRSQG